MRRQSDTSSSRRVLKFIKTRAWTRVSRRGRESYFILKCQKEKGLLSKNNKTRGVVGHPVGTKFLSLYIMY
jgi:hypothetical protein